MAIGYIYMITNLINDKIYIGQHLSPVFDKYYWGGGTVLKRALKKYGKNNFVRDVLCWCESQEDLDDKEKFYIKLYHSQNKNIGYNIVDGGNGCSGYHHTSEFKLKMSKIHEGQIPWNKGKKWDVEIIIKFKNAHKGMKKPWMKSSVICDNIIFDSVTDCAKYLGLKNTKHMPRYLKNGVYKNHTLKYLNKRRGGN